MPATSSLYYLKTPDQ